MKIYPNLNYKVASYRVGSLSPESYALVTKMFSIDLWNIIKAYMELIDLGEVTVSKKTYF